MYNEKNEYLKKMWEDLRAIDDKFTDFKVMLHNLDKLGYNVDDYNKLLDNVGIELYKLKIFNNDYTKEKLKK